MCKSVDIRRGKFCFLFCRVESDEQTHTHWEKSSVFVIYWRLWRGQNVRCKIYRVRIRNLVSRSHSCWICPTEGQCWRERAALECDFKYFAVQYFVGDCALDRVLLALQFSSITDSAAASVDQSYQTNRSTLKSCYMCTINLVLVVCKFRSHHHSRGRGRTKCGESCVKKCTRVPC